MQEVVEYIGNNCYIPTSDNWFIKCINYLIGTDYTEFSTFIRTERKRSIVITSARSQPVRRKKISTSFALVERE